MKQLSVIVPVYNREHQLKKALDSIVKQLDETMELVIINDGSTDESEKVIKKYKEKYKGLISYYAKKNEGVAATRNFGIEHALGEYILFVDSDDYIKEDLIEKLQPYMEQKIDIIKYKLNRVDEEGNILEKVSGPVFEKMDGQAGFNKLAFDDILLDSPCVYAFKKNLFVKNNLFFKVGTQHEDFGLIPLVLLTAKTIISLNIEGYNYVQVENSITRNDDYKKTIKKMKDVLQHYDYMIEWVSNRDLDIKTKKNIKTYYTNAIILKLRELNKSDRRQAIYEIKKRKMISNIQVHNLKQLFKKIILLLDINLYLKLK